MKRTWMKVLVLIIVLLVGMVFGMLLMTAYLAESKTVRNADPCRDTHPSVPLPHPDAWTVEPFRFAPVEHGVYYLEQTKERERDEFGL